MSSNVDATAASTLTAVGNDSTSQLQNSSINSMKDMTDMYIFAQQAQQEMSMISTLGGLAQDAAKDKPQV